MRVPRAHAPIAIERSFVEANLSGDKKATHRALAGTRGKRVSAEVVLPRAVTCERLHVTPDQLAAYWQIGAIGSAMSGAIGMQGHAANGLAALALATGQDVACVAESAVGITRFTRTPNGDCYAAVTLPNIVVGTVGGGTSLPTQHAGLEIVAGGQAALGQGLRGDHRRRRAGRRALDQRGHLRGRVHRGAPALRARGASVVNRFWIYQRERFPLLGHGLVIAAFSASAIAYSAFARHAALPAPWLLAAGFVSSLLFFAQMRIADEWKDAGDDRLYRPYRPVPRGLVTLQELAWIGAGAGVVQLAIAAVVSPGLIARCSACGVTSR